MKHAPSKKHLIIRGFRSCSALSAALSLIFVNITPFSAIKPIAIFLYDNQQFTVGRIN